MALIICPECGGKVSSMAQICIHCGYPLTTTGNNTSSTSLIKDCSDDVDILHKTTCPHCGKETSSRKVNCQHCGKTMVKVEHYSSAPLVKENRVKSSNECPRCGSTQIQAMKKGFGFGKAVVGTLIAGPYGVLAGGIGSADIQRVCLKCGHKF